MGYWVSASSIYTIFVAKTEFPRPHLSLKFKSPDKEYLNLPSSNGSLIRSKKLGSEEVTVSIQSSTSLISIFFNFYTDSDSKNVRYSLKHLLKVKRLKSSMMFPRISSCFSLAWEISWWHCPLSKTFPSKGMPNLP